MRNNIICSFFIFIIGAYLISQDFILPYKTWTIKNQANAWSSALYAFPVAPLSIKAPLLTLSIASFGLWANSTPAVNFVDVTSIFWVIIVVSIHVLPGAKHKNLVIYCIDGAFASAIATTLYLGYEHVALNYYQENLVPITGIIMGISVANTTSYYGNVRLYSVGTGLIVIGFGCKLLTIYYDQYWGTCVFHTSTAAGIAVLLSDKLTLETEHDKDNDNDGFVQFDGV